MDKWKLIEITLEQLIAQWTHNKDLFDSDLIEDHILTSNSADPFVSWEPPSDTTRKLDSLAIVSKKVKITYNRYGKYFKCEIIGRNGLSANTKPDIIIIAKKSLIPIRSLYRRFMTLRSSVQTYYKIRNSNKYLDDLCKVFPGTLDEILLGSGDE